MIPAPNVAQRPVRFIRMWESYLKDLVSTKLTHRALLRRVRLSQIANRGAGVYPVLFPLPVLHQLLNRLLDRFRLGFLKESTRSYIS